LLEALGSLTLAFNNMGGPAGTLTVDSKVVSTQSSDDADRAPSAPQEYRRARTGHAATRAPNRRVHRFSRRNYGRA
jgi:hypothetical protein